MEQNIGLCGVWGTPASIRNNYEIAGTLCYSPRVLGLYLHYENGVIPYLDDRVRVKLTSWIIEQRELLSQDQSVSNNYPVIVSEVIDNVKNVKDLEVEERADITIKYLRSKSSVLGTVVTIPRFDGKDNKLPVNELEIKYEDLYGLLCVSECTDDAELEMVLNRLYRRKEIEFIRADSGFRVMI